MKRLHTRVQRKLNLNTRRNHGYRKYVKKHGPKTFATEEKAKEHATKTLKLKDYEIVPAKKGRRYKVAGKD